MSFVNLKIGQRLAGTFGIIVILLISITSLGVLRLGTLDQSAALIIQDRYPKVMRAVSILSEINHIAIAMRNALIFEDPQQIQSELNKVPAAREVIDKNLDELKILLATPGGRSILEKILGRLSEYRAGQNEFLSLMSAGRKLDASTLLVGRVMVSQAAYALEVQNLIDLGAHLIETEGAQVNIDYRNGVTVMLILAAITILLALAFAYWVTRGITRPLNKAVLIANTVAAGDLSSVIEVSSRDETGQLMRALMHMNNNLKRTVDDVRHSTGMIATASGQIAAGNIDLSSRTERQASALTETASSMEELTATVQQNADNALQANQLASSASQIASKGGAMVDQVIDTMGMIEQSSQEIVEIISVINGIAFQTNILALNAAVEAARAGQEGRGFAVVATEVRSLAQRAADAAKEIKTLIDNSVSKIREGSVQVAETGRTMGEIVTSVEHVTHIMSEIATASQQQTAGIEQVNQAIMEMDAVTQQNAALVEQAAAATASLQDQAHALADLVGIFKLGHIADIDVTNQDMGATPTPSAPHYARPALSVTLKQLA